MEETIRHPAKYTDSFIPVFADVLNKNGCKKILDPFAGTGKIGQVKNEGYTGYVFANEIEPEWLRNNKFSCDVVSYMDAENLTECYEEESFDAIVTSPTYGNRMADHHNAKDGSKRNTYTHCIGHQLHDGNTGKMQWGDEYRSKHTKIYNKICKLIKHGGLFVLNISNHIRQGKEINVCDFHKQAILDNGFELIKDYEIQTSRNRFGEHSELRCYCEHIYVFRRT